MLVSAGVVELVDTPDLGSGAVRCESSSLSSRTIIINNNLLRHVVKQLDWDIAKR